MSIAGGINFQGMGSGTDFSAMIKKLKEAESFRITRLEKWKGDWEKRITAFDDIMETMSELQSKTNGLTKIDNLIKRAGSTSSETTASVTAEPNAIPGTHTLEILQLASASTQSSKQIFKKNEDNKFDSLLPEGTVIEDGKNYFEYTYGVGDKAKTVKIALDKDTTIEDLVNRINNDSKNPGVKASLISNGSGYLFQIQGKNTGEENALSIKTDIAAFNTDPTTPIDDADFNNMQAKDAKFILNGFKDQILTSSSNSVKGVIEGVTITLKNVTEKDKPLNITISSDTTALKEKVTEWVDSVNELRTKIQSLTKVDSSAKAKDPNKVNSQWDAEIGSVLTGNYAVQLLSSRLNSIVGGPAYGLTSSKAEGDEPASFSIMAELGIKTNAVEGTKDYGLLVIDEEILDQAIKDSPDSIAKLLAGNTGEAKSDNFLFSSATSTVKAGKYDVKYATDATGAIDPETVFINGVKASYDEKFPGRFTVGEQSNAAYGLSIQFTPGVLEPNKTFTGDTVSVIKGKGVELNEFFTNEIRDIEGGENNGGIAIVRGNYEDIVKNIDRKLVQENERLDLWETRQKARFARLDAYLAVAQQQMTANASALAQGNKSS